MAALPIAPTDSETLVWGQKIDALYLRGEAHIEKKNYQEAMETFKELALFLQAHGAEKQSPFERLVASRIEQAAENLGIPVCPDCNSRHKDCSVQ